MGGGVIADENVWFEIRKIRSSGIIVAVFEKEGLNSDINIMDISAALLTEGSDITDITLRMDISTTNEVTAFLDIGSDGSFETEMPGSYVLTLKQMAQMGRLPQGQVIRFQSALVLLPGGVWV